MELSVGEELDAGEEVKTADYALFVAGVEQKPVPRDLLDLKQLSMSEHFLTQESKISDDYLIADVAVAVWH